MTDKMVDHRGQVVDLGTVKAELPKRLDIPESRPGPVLEEESQRAGRATKRDFRVNHRHAAEALSHLRGYAVDPAKVALKLADADHTEQYEASHEAVVWKVWDRKSPINGVPAKEVLARYPYAKEVYLLQIDGNTVVFQPHAPHVPGLVPLKHSNVEEIAQEHAAEVVEKMAFDIVVAELNEDPDLVAVPAFAQDTDALARAVADRINARGPRASRLG